MRFWKHGQIEEKSFEGQTTLPGYASGGNGGNIETGSLESFTGRHEKQPTDRITGYQIFYVFGLNGIGAAILSGGINFALAYGMYSTQKVEIHPIRLFQLPNTLAGDAVVTMVIQTMVTWFIELILVEYDMKKGAIRPMGFVREPSLPLLRRLMLLDREESRHSSNRTTLLVDHAVRIALMFVVSFVLLWPASIGILTTIGERRGGGDWDWYFQRQWAPQAFKAIYGGLLSFLTTPAMASFWLVKEGWRLKRGGALLSR